ncbi:MAG TPA: hypothetical protein VH816_09670 [Gaiellaceae bacterium]
MIRRHLGVGLACVAIAVAVAVAIVLVASTGSSKAAPTRAEYFGKVAAICRFYGPKLDKIPPPIDVTIPAEITESVRKVEPILRAEAEAVRRLRPPRELRAQLARWNELNRQSIAKLGEALRAAEKTDLRGIQVAYVEFVVTGAKAQKLGHAIGFPSPPC